MTQQALFDRINPPPALPVQGRGVVSRAASTDGARVAAAHRASLQQRYLDLLLRVGAHGATDHEAAAHLRCGVSSLCSTRAGLGAQLVEHGHRTGPAGARNTVYVLRIVTGARFDEVGA
jgi:hypothetical protein